MSTLLPGRGSKVNPRVCSAFGLYRGAKSTSKQFEEKKSDAFGEKRVKDEAFVDPSCLAS